MQITVLSQPSCGPCVAVKKYLSSSGLEFSDRNIQDDPEALDLFKEIGYPRTPVVVIDDDAWGVDTGISLSAFVAESRKETS